MNQRLLREQGATLRESSAGKWRVTLITAGVGSSATYGEDVLERDAETAFPAGMKLWWGHPKDWEGPGDRDARDQWGRLDRPAFYTPGVGIEAEVTLKKHWAEVVESIGTDADLSVYVMAHVDEDGNATHLLPDRTNSVDIVSYAGRPGSGLTQKLEAARASYKPPVISAEDQRNRSTTMDPKDLEAIKLAITEALKPIADALTEAKTAAEQAAQGEADKAAVDAAVEAAVKQHSAQVAAIAEAKLLPSQAKALTERSEKGEDVTAAIAEAKAVAEEAKQALTESVDGYVIAPASGAKHNYSIGGRR